MLRHKTSTLIIALALIVLPALSWAYQTSLQAAVDKPTVGKGEGFTYKLSIIEEGEADRPVQLVPPDFTGFNVSGRFSSSSIKVINNKARRVTEQDYRLSSDIAGDHDIPPAKLVMTDPNPGKTQEMASNAVKVHVSEKAAGVLKGLEEDIRDIKGPKTFLDKVRLFFLGMMALVVLVFFLLLGLAIYMVRRKKKIKPAAPSYQPAQTSLAPREKALAALAAAEPLMSDPKAFYSAVSGAVREYLAATRGVSAVEKTTTEIMAEVSQAGLPAPARDRLWALLGEADMVKFAKHTPTEDEMRRFIDSARGLVRDI